MARIVMRTPSEPTKFTIDGKEQWFCKLYWYDEAGTRHELKADLPGIRRF